MEQPFTGDAYTFDYVIIGFGVVSLVFAREFVLKNNLFEFNSKVFQQISGTAIGTKFAPPYACIYMDRVEQDFLETQELQPLLWLRYIDDIFGLMEKKS